MGKELELNCEELKRLVDTLHPQTRVNDLENEEITEVFYKPIELGKDDDLTSPGAMFEVIRIHLEEAPVFNFRSLQNKTIRDLYEENCED